MVSRRVLFVGSERLLIYIKKHNATLTDLNIPGNIDKRQYRIINDQNTHQQTHPSFKPRQSTTRRLIVSHNATVNINIKHNHIPVYKNTKHNQTSSPDIASISSTLYNNIIWITTK